MEAQIYTLTSHLHDEQVVDAVSLQANPANIDPEAGELLFVHCTIPLPL